MVCERNVVSWEDFQPHKPIGKGGSDGNPHEGGCKLRLRQASRESLFLMMQGLQEKKRRKIQVKIQSESFI